MLDVPGLQKGAEMSSRYPNEFKQMVNRIVTVEGKSITRVSPVIANNLPKVQ